MRFSTRWVTSIVPQIALVFAALSVAHRAQAQSAGTGKGPPPAAATKPVAPAAKPAATPAAGAPPAAAATALPVAKTATAPGAPATTTATASRAPGAAVSASASPPATATTVAPATTGAPAAAASASGTASGGGSASAGSAGAVTAPVAVTPAPAATTPAPAAALPLTKVTTKVTEEDEPAGEPLWTGTARFADRYYELGVTAGRGGLLFAKGASTPGLTGIRVLEHHGYISKAAVTIAVALGQSNSRYAGSSYHSSGGYNYRVDYYRPLTGAERQAQAQMLSDAISGEYTTELTYYSSNIFGLGGTGSGFEVMMGGDIPLGYIGKLPAVLTLGGYGAYISSPVTWDDKTRKDAPKELSFTGVGLAARAHIPILPLADALIEWDINIASLFDSGAKNRETLGELYGSPLKVGGYFHLTDRGYIKAQGVLGGFGFSDGKLGYQAELGVRF